MNIYFRIVFSVFLLVAIFGFLGPWCISQNSDEMVLAGIALLVFTPVILLWGWNDKVIQFFKWIKK